ncbi:MAG: DMT family transporter [Elainella sp. Prado103]|nr:DMT family transporter [Elainella sp. Prado103]
MKRSGDFVIGFLVVLLSSIFFCFQNVIVRVLFNEQTILGIFETGGFVPPTLQYSFLLMFMRMLVGVPLLSGIAPKLYPPIWQEIRCLTKPSHRSVSWQALICGGLMFLYLAQLYISIGLIPTGIALTLFFTYPVFTAIFSWYWFGDRLDTFRGSVMLLVMFGSALTLPLTTATIDQSTWIGMGMGLASGVTYALYTVVAQKAFEALHPVPFSWISFATTLLLSGICLLFWSDGLQNLPWTALWIGSFLSALATFTGHLLNNLGIRFIGATTASMIGATNPALTVILAWLTIHETLSAIQILGVSLVTFSIALLSRGRFANHVNQSKEP